MLASRLTVGGAATYTPAAFPVTTLTSAAAGGWVQVVTPRAVHDSNGYLYIGYIRGNNGNIEVVVRADSTGTVTGPTVLHAALEVDTHDCPALLIGADRKLLVFYTKHATEAKIYYRISTNTIDSDPTLSGGFAAEQTISHGTHQTYCSVVQLTGETNSPIYLFTRDYQTGDTIAKLVLTKSTDNGATWSAQTEIATKTSTTGFYWIITSNGTDRIDFAVSDGNGVSDNPVNTYHWFYTGGSYYQTDGTLISASQPFAPSSGTLAYASTEDGPGWPTGIAYDDTSGRLAITVEAGIHITAGLADQTRVRYARWSAGAWSTAAVATSVDTGLSYIAHSALDDTTMNTVYVCKAVSGVYELFRYDTFDGGVTWVEQAQLTASSASTGNVYPVVVKDYQTAGPRVLVLFGTYTTYLSNSLGIRAAA